MDPGKTFGKNANSCHCGISMPAAGPCKHSSGIVQAATSKPNSPSVEAGGLPMRHRSFEHPAMTWHVCMGKQKVMYVVWLWAIPVRSSKLTITYLICFASVVGQCQDLHGQGFCTNAANQLYEVPCVLQIICKAIYLCKPLFESREQGHNLSQAHKPTWAVTCHCASANHGSHTQAHLQLQSWLCKNHQASKQQHRMAVHTIRQCLCCHTKTCRMQSLLLREQCTRPGCFWTVQVRFQKHQTTGGKALMIIPACQESALLRQARQRTPHRSKC